MDEWKRGENWEVHYEDTVTHEDFQEDIRAESPEEAKAIFEAQRAEKGAGDRSRVWAVYCK